MVGLGAHHRPAPRRTFRLPPRSFGSGRSDISTRIDCPRARSQPHRVFGPTSGSVSSPGAVMSSAVHALAVLVTRCGNAGTHHFRLLLPNPRSLAIAVE